MSPSRLETSSFTKKAVSTLSIGNSSKQPAASTSPVSSYRLDTAAVMSPNSNATVEASRDDPDPSTPTTRVLAEHLLSSKDNNHNDPDSAYSGFSAMQTLVGGNNNSDSTSSSVKATTSKAVPPRSNAKASKKTLGKHPRANSGASSASLNGTAVVPAKKRVRSNALMRSAPRATSTTTPGGLAGNSEFMCVLPSYAKIQS